MKIQVEIYGRCVGLNNYHRYKVWFSYKQHVLSTRVAYFCDRCREGWRTLDSYSKFMFRKWVFLGRCIGFNAFEGIRCGQTPNERILGFFLTWPVDFPFNSAFWSLFIFEHLVSIVWNETALMFTRCWRVTHLSVMTRPVVDFWHFRSSACSLRLGKSARQFPTASWQKQPLAHARWSRVGEFRLALFPLM